MAAAFKPVGLFGRRETVVLQTNATAPKLTVVNGAEKEGRPDLDHASVSVLLKKGHERFLPPQIEHKKVSIPASDLLAVKVGRSLQIQVLTSVSDADIIPCTCRSQMRRLDCFQDTTRFNVSSACLALHI